MRSFQPTVCFIKNGDVVAEFGKLKNEWKDNSIELIWDFNETAQRCKTLVISEANSMGPRGMTSCLTERIHLYTIFVNGSASSVRRILSVLLCHMQLCRLICRFRPKYVVCSNLRFLGLTLSLCTLLRCSFIVNFARETQLTRLNLTLIRLFAIRNIIVPGRYLKRCLQARGMQSDIYVRLPKYPDVFFHDRHLSDFPQHAFTVIFVARMERAKGVHELYAAASDVVRRFPDVGFVFVGDGRDLQCLKARVRSDHLNGNIHFLGHKDNLLVGSYLRRSDVLAFPTYTEGFAKTWYEAVLTQTPIIGTKLPAISEYLRDSMEILYVDLRMPNSLSDAIVRLRGDENLRSRMKANLREARVRIAESADGSLHDCVRFIVGELEPVGAGRSIADD